MFDDTSVLHFNDSILHFILISENLLQSSVINKMQKNNLDALPLH